MPTPDESAAPKADPVILPAMPDTRLASLVADYERLKPELDKLAAQVKEITDAIKYEVRTTLPDAWSIDVWTSSSVKPIKIRGSRRRNFRSAVFAKEHPVEYVSYCEWKERWEISY
jgi:hypothetical protein